MKNRKIATMAICYDFDGTLSPGYMQEYGFFMGLPQKDRKTFWQKSNALAKEKNADPILTYMLRMIEEASNVGLGLGTTHKDFRAYGKDIKFFNGVPNWFKRIAVYAAEKGVQLNHYIISSGLKEIVEGSKIGRCFKEIFACSFIHGVNDAAKWPAQVVNFTTKTQYLFRINKGSEDISDTISVNGYIAPEDRPVPFSHMIYIGDGETDVPCMRLVKEQGGHSIAVYAPGRKKAHATALGLFKDGRVNYVVPADYSEGKLLDNVVKGVIDVVAARAKLKLVSKSAVPVAKNGSRSQNAVDRKIADVGEETLRVADGTATAGHETVVTTVELESVAESSRDGQFATGKVNG